MASRASAVALLVALVMVSVAFVAVEGVPNGSASPGMSVSVTPASTGASSTGVNPQVVTPGESINYTYSDFFNVPYGEWWDERTNAKYGDEPIGASCFNQTSVNDGTCTTNVAGIPRVAQYPYENWAGPGTATATYAPYRMKVVASAVGGYNLSQPVFLPVLNYAAAPGSTLRFNWNMQYLDVANYTLVTSTRGCYAASGANANDGYQLWNKIYLTLDNQEAARLFGATVSSTTSTIQSWWNTNTLSGCSMSTKQAGPLETSVNNWFAAQANGKYDIYNGYAGAYFSLFTNITATVVSGGPTGLTNVVIEHGAWGTETLLDRFFYWGNATYAGHQLDSSKAKGWWGMENGWLEGVHYAGMMTPAAMAFNLTSVLQYHFQEHSAPGPDGVYRSSTNLADSDDIPYWTWGPQLLDYVASTGPHPNSEMDRYAGLNYIKTTPGSGDYGTNTSFDYTPISWNAKAGESWFFQFPTQSASYFQNPATATLGTNLPTTQLPAINSAMSLMKIFPPPGYGVWNPVRGWWIVNGPTTVSWPTGTPGSYPYIPYPGIYLQPGNIPPAVTTNAATAVTTTTATLNGATSTLGTATSVGVGFFWGTSPTLSGAANLSAGTQTAAGAFSSGITGLTPGTTYYFQAWASGNGFVKGAILSFTAAVTPPSVTTNAATAIGTTTATLNGNLASLGTATSVQVGFLWGTSSTLTGAANVTVGTQTTTGAFTSVLTGLTPGTTYYFQAWANGQGFAKGSILNFPTTATPPSVTTSAASAVGTTTATLNGNLGSLGSAASVTVGFYYGTSPTLSGATNATLGTHAVGAFSDPITGLTPGTTYYFEAWANGQGFAVGGILNFKTSTTPPSVTTNPASGVTTSAATLNGATSSLGTATSVGVGFFWGTSPSLSGAANVSAGTQTVAGAFSTALSSLAPGTTYYFQAWANGNGFVTGSILNFKTSVTPPSVATNPASSITTVSATLNGATSSLGTASSVGVGFFYGTSPTLSGATNASVATQTAIGSFSLALSSLTPGTTYYFQAWANGNGFAKGAILNFATSVTPPAVATEPATGLTTTAATLNGATSSLGTATSVGVGFFWGTSPTLAGAANVSAGTQTVAGSFSAALSALTPGTKYYFAAWANGNGFVQGAILSFSTGVTPPSVVTDAATGVATVAATLNGHTTSLGTATSVGVGFLWGTSPSLSGATNVTVGTQTAVGAFLDPLSGLSPGTTYYFQAWANGQGFVVGLIVSFTTPTAPPSVSTTAATAITSTGGTLNGNLASLGTASSVTVGFLWGTSNTLSGATNATVGSKTVTGAFSLILSSLTPGVTYYFQAWANGNGFAAGSILSFTTGISPPAVTTNAATSLGTTSATLNGATSSLGTATSVQVGFYWGTSPSLSGATNVSVTTQTAPGSFSSALSSLTPGTTYYFQAWAIGNGLATGAILSFKTTTTPPSVTTNAASSIGTAAATLNGATSSLGTATSVQVGFYWGTASNLAGATNVTVTTQTVAGAFLDALSGLTPGTTYYFQAWANGQGFAKGTILSFTTPTLPPAVTTGAATLVTSTGATLNGNLASLGTAASVSVGFFYGTDPGLLGATNVSLGAHALGSFSDAISGLSPGTTYYFEAWANGQGFATGGILSFTTGTAPPSVATNPATGVATTSATLNGATSSLGTAASVTVGFLWGTSASLSGAANVTVGTQTAIGSFSLALSSLTPGTTYYFAAWAVGNGFAMGSTLSFTAGVSPPSVVTNAASGVTTSAATLNGMTTDLGTATSVDVGFLWGTSPSLSGAANVTVTTQTVAGAFVLPLSSLAPGATYYFQAWALGNGFAAGSILSFTTAVIAPSVTTSPASGVTTSAATLNGNLASLGTAASVSVGFRYGTDPGLVGATNATVGPMSAVGAFLDAVSGLTPGTTYYFEAWANGQGFAAGTILSFTTGTTPPAVATSAASGVGATTATLNGATSDLGTATSVSVGFLWGTDPLLAGATNVTVGAQSAAGAFSEPLSGLAPATTYYFAAWALGDGYVQGGILSFTTTLAPPVVQTDPASGITSTGATLNGATTDLGSVTALLVGFFYGTDPGLVGATNASAAVQNAPGSYSLALSGLTPGTTYYFQAWANGSGFVTGSILSFTTIQATFNVTFTESGLPSGTLWSVTLGGVTQSSTFSVILFTEAPGTYAFTVGAVSGFTASPSSGSVTVGTSFVDTPVTFTAVTPTLCADLFNRSAWASTRNLKLSKTVVETLWGRVINCGNTPVSVYVLFNVYTKGTSTLVGTFATPVFVSLLPGQIVNLSVDWTNPPTGSYVAVAQAFYGAVGTTPGTPGATIKSFQFKVVSGGKTALLDPAALVGLALGWSGTALPLRRLRKRRPE